MKINPMDSQYDGSNSASEGDRNCGEGLKLVAAVGFERYMSKSGKNMLAVRYICLKDLEDGGDEKRVAFDNFALTDRALWRLVELARAVGYSEPFDPEDDEDIGKLLTHGFCNLNLVEETWNGRTSYRPGRKGDTPAYSKAAAIPEDPDWGSWIEAAEDNHRSYLDWRAKNPRGGGSSNFTSKSSPPPSDDDIPF